MTSAPGQASAEEGAGIPTWLRPVADAAGTIRAQQLSRFRQPKDATPREASVLVLFGESEEGPGVLLIERAHDMRSHAGQVAFPGGAQDPDDADAVAAALREAEEETGLDPAGVEVIGVLPKIWLQPSNFTVTPVLGWWHTPSAVTVVDPAETASVHTITLDELLDPANRVTVRHPSGFLGPGFLVRGLVVWGFTALLLSRLFAIVGWERAWDDDRVVDLPDDLASSSMRDLESAIEAGRLRRDDLSPSMPAAASEASAVRDGGAEQ